MNSKKQTILAALLLTAMICAGCGADAAGNFYGRTVAPTDDVVKYVSGSEPESLDPAIPTGQPEARVLMALFDGLVEYHPKTMEAMPALAESWKVSEDQTEYTFNLRKGAKFTNGDEIKAKDFVYSLRRAVSPELAAKNAYLAYYIRNVEAYNAGKSFVQNDDGTFLLKDAAAVQPEGEAPKTSFDGAERLTVPGDTKSLDELFAKDAKLKARVEGKKLVPVTAEDIGVIAEDEYVVRIKLMLPAPYFMGLLGHQFFRVVHQGTIEKHGALWTRPENIVTNGAFKLITHDPYDKLVLEKNPGYWDAEMVRLKGIEFYPLEEATTMMNLYKAGSVYAMYNHTPPAAWNEVIREYKDEYLNFPEVAIEYYTVNVKKAPMNNPKLRKAFALAIDRDALAKFRRTTQPLVDFTPEGIFPKYEEARTKVYTEELAKIGSSLEEWKARKFDAEAARKILGELGYKVEKSGNGYITRDFPGDQVDLTYNTAESNKAVAEFIQAQWKQNLGITVPLKNMEWKTFLNVRKNLEYNGMARAGWVGDYMDPFTFLGLFYSENNDSSTGWSRPEFDRLLDSANKDPDEMGRFEKLARAEFMMIQEQPVIPLQTQATNWIKKPYIKGLYPNPGTLHAWKFVYIETDESKWDRDVANTIMTQKDPWVYQHIDRLMATQNAFVATQANNKIGE